MPGQSGLRFGPKLCGGVGHVSLHNFLFACSNEFSLRSVHLDTYSLYCADGQRSTSSVEKKAFAVSRSVFWPKLVDESKNDRNCVFVVFHVFNSLP